MGWVGVGWNGIVAAIQRGERQGNSWERGVLERGHVCPGDIAQLHRRESLGLRAPKVSEALGLYKHRVYLICG